VSGCNTYRESNSISFVVFQAFAVVHCLNPFHLLNETELSVHTGDTGVVVLCGVKLSSAASFESQLQVFAPLRLLPRTGYEAGPLSW
jgi:hypothetical protein